ncbi:MAG: NADH-quinone oxidoreductase subunit J [Archangiaceae bacterium]|nr:NADH-quinone oxidoreductase subunit J [Archangiaceae bacterium]
MSPEQILFWVFAVATVFSALGVVVLKNPIASAMSLVATFFFLAGIYVLLWAHTVAALQVLVYAGAIMVLFLFVIMLLSINDVGPAVQLSFSRLLGAVATAALLAALVLAFRKLPTSDLAWANDPARLASFGSIKEVGAIMYTQWLFPFEAVSLLLLVAIVGAVVVAKSRI